MFLQQLDDGRVRIMTSASDLAAASACEFAFLRRVDARLGRDVVVPPDDDAMLARAARLGDAHEERVLARYLEQFGDDMRRLAPEAYVKQRQLIALWHLLAGERRAGIRQLWLARRAGGALRQHLLGAAMACLPAPVLRRAFLWRYERNLNRTR